MGSETGAEQEIGKIIERVSISTANVDKLAKLVQELLEKEKDNTGNVQKQFITYQGPGLGIACLLVAACVLSVFSLLYAYGIKTDTATAVITIKQDIDKDSARHDNIERDLKAWVDRHTGEIATLKAKEK